MSKIGTIKFEGISGISYDFNIYDINTNWNDNVSAIYVVSKRYQSDNKYKHKKIYIGRTTNLKERFSQHHKEECFIKNNANCISILLEKDEDKLAQIETDLIKGNSTLCNEI